MSGQVSRDSACEYQADERSGEKDYNKILEVYEEDTSFEILDAYRNNLMIIMFKLRMKREKVKEDYKKKATNSTKEAENKTFTQEDSDDEYYPF